MAEMNATALYDADLDGDSVAVVEQLDASTDVMAARATALRVLAMSGQELRQLAADDTALASLRMTIDAACAHVEMMCELLARAERRVLEASVSRPS